MKHKQLQQKLLSWFSENSRDLPWRKSYLPYHIWISEIMLQQTQMDRVVDYFNRWVERFPDIESITRASEDEIIKLWEGLGYYRRVKNIAKTAEVIVGEYNGELPSDHKTLLKLPGIGPYTAGAIMSLAFNREYPSVDGNVERVFARLFDIDKPVKEKESWKFVWRMAEELIPGGKAREFNQSMMELGALICTPQNPQCFICPIKSHCLAFKNDIVSARPVLAENQKTVSLAMVAGVLVCNGKILVRKRPEGTVWGGLWEFPGGRLEKRQAKIKGLKDAFYEKTGLQIDVTGRIGIVKHSYTIHRVSLYSYYCTLVNNDTSLPKAIDGAELLWIDPEDLDRLAFSSGHRKLIQKYIGQSG